VGLFYKGLSTMSTIIVSLSKAVICIAAQCYPALVGASTPTGTFELENVLVNSQGYGGDVLMFKETPTEIFAIHRVWTLKPKERRLERLESPNAQDRHGITGGCINVEPEVYDLLVEEADTLRIVP
jgi:hypothetical protein